MRQTFDWCAAAWWRKVRGQTLELISGRRGLRPADRHTTARWSAARPDTPDCDSSADRQQTESGKRGNVLWKCVWEAKHASWRSKRMIRNSWMEEVSLQSCEEQLWFQIRHQNCSHLRHHHKPVPVLLVGRLPQRGKLDVISQNRISCRQKIHQQWGFLMRSRVTAFTYSPVKHEVMERKCSFLRK